LQIEYIFFSSLQDEKKNIEQVSYFLSVTRRNHKRKEDMTLPPTPSMMMTRARTTES
jgi:hypothetical protein